MADAEVVAEERLRAGGSMLDAYPSRGYYDRGNAPS
jgi:hypothetical protein